MTLTCYYSAAKKSEQKLNEYQYDRQGQLCKVTCHMAGKTYRMAYDFLGRLMRVADERGYMSMYEYDAENNMTRLYHATTSALAAAYTYDKDGRETQTKVYRDSTIQTQYDQFGRVDTKIWDASTARADCDPYMITYRYPSTGNQYGAVPNQLLLGAKTIIYTYDKNYNITEIATAEKQGGTFQTDTFRYDERNQLIRENSKSQNKTFAYAYDAGGNLVSVKEYAYTTAEALPAAPVKTITGTYDTKWKDKLVKWNGVSMTYDAVGNMLTRGSTKYTWMLGRKLATVNNGKNIQYFYDHNGLRTKKIVDGLTTHYCLAGELVMSQETSAGKKLWFSYDSAGNVVSLATGSKSYYYARNLQNDIVAIIDEAGKAVVEYKYDSWGRVLSITGSLKDTIGAANPFRYRGYYFDEETGMYYVQSRYYDPELRRFINADDVSVVQTNLDTLTHQNLYAYCDENPLTRKDENGGFWVEALVGAAINVASTFIAAKVTGQEYGIRDGIAAGAAGFVGAINKGGALIGGVITGAYTIYSNRRNGASWSGAISSGVFSGVLAYASISTLQKNIYKELNVNIPKSVKTVTDATFALPANCMAAASAKAVTYGKTTAAKKKNPVHWTSMINPKLAIGANIKYMGTWFGQVYIMYTYRRR